jgi:ATP-dependent DNA helicase PIF1
MELSREQQIAFDKYVQGENIFITGPGGAGKSALIRKIVYDAKENSKKVQVCATTGRAAVLLKCNAKTIHSWGGIGIAKGDNNKIAERICKNKKKKYNWTRVEILIVDEVSMMSQKLFELLNLVAQKCRKNNRFFGGIQVIFSGDFCQLPPVARSDDPQECHNYCFESKLWREIFKTQINLTTIFRQKDPVYTKILNEIRNARIKMSSINILKKYVGREYENNEIKPTILYPTKYKAKQTNDREMNKIKEDGKVFELKECEPTELELTPEQRASSEDATLTEIKKEYEYLKSSVNCDDKLVFKKGSQVMCIANLNLEGEFPICNGSQGIIKDFTESGLPIVKFKNGLSKIIDFHIWRSENIASVAVKQIPLILSWAITIHKSQGATLDYAEIDIGSGIFACGQTYVALSRVVDLEGLYIKSFNPQNISISKKVINYYKSMENEYSVKTK